MRVVWKVRRQTSRFLRPEVSVKPIFFWFGYTRFCHFSTELLPWHVTSQLRPYTCPRLCYHKSLGHSGLPPTTQEDMAGIQNHGLLKLDEQCCANNATVQQQHLLSTFFHLQRKVSEVPPNIPTLPSSIKSVSRALSQAGRRPGFWQQWGSGCARTPSHHADSSASLFPPVAICFSCLILRLQICCEASHRLPSSSHSTYQQHGMLGPEQGSWVL